jgi:hypothetical protein
MTGHDSDSELAGKMAASLTPPVVHVPLQRGAQNSGLFDLDALYTMHVEEIRLPALPLPPALRRAPRPQVVEALLHEAPLVPSAARVQPIGWFAVFIAWLATITLAGVVTTQLPGHVAVRARGVAPVAATLPGSSSPSTTAAASAAASATMPGGAMTATVTASGPSVMVFSDLPRAVLPEPRPHARHSAPRTSAAASALPDGAVSSPPPQTVRVVAAAPSTPPPASNGGSSLEDLIRHEVAAEQKRLHAAPPGK